MWDEQLWGGFYRWAWAPESGRDARIPRVERRRFLALGATAVALAGCTGQSSQPGPPSAPAAPTTPGDPDASLREEVAASEGALIVAYRSAIATFPALAADLEPLLAHHEEHLARVAPGFVAGTASPGTSQAPSSLPSSGSSPTGSSSSGSSPTGSTSSGSSSPRAVLVELATAESAANAQRATSCDGAQDPALARDLCLIAASEGQHASVLEGLAAGGSEP